MNPQNPPGKFMCYVKRHGNGTPKWDYSDPDNPVLTHVPYLHPIRGGHSWEAGPSYTNGLYGAEQEEWIYWGSGDDEFYHYPPGTSSGADGWDLD